jgi:hypothetical protein
MQLLKEIIAVGFLTLLIGLIVSRVMMGKEAEHFKHWPQVAASYFITGALIHIICEATGINKWYCTNGHACQPGTPRSPGQPRDTLP